MIVTVVKVDNCDLEILKQLIFEQDMYQFKLILFLPIINSQVLLNICYITSKVE